LVGRHISDLVVRPRFYSSTSTVRPDVLAASPRRPRFGRRARANVRSYDGRVLRCSYLGWRGPASLCGSRKRRSAQCGNQKIATDICAYQAAATNTGKGKCVCAGLLSKGIVPLNPRSRSIRATSLQYRGRKSAPAISASRPPPIGSAKKACKKKRATYRRHSFSPEPRTENRDAGLNIFKSEHCCTDIR
jgi:hypothetical protein